MLIILNRIGFPVDDDQTILLFGACLEDGKVNFDHFLKIIDYRSGKLDKLESTLTDDCLLKLSKESAFTTKYDVHDGTFNSVSVKVYIVVLHWFIPFRILKDVGCLLFDLIWRHQYYAEYRMI